MRKYFYILFFSFFLINCTSNTIIKKPDNLISKDEMVNILTDLFLANGGKNIKNIHSQRNINYYPLVFEKYQIDSTQFKESNYYYTSKIDDYDKILERVDARLKKLRDQYEIERKLEDSLRKSKKDSIKIANTKKEEA
ncbi:DUF4296 domain-containing protein [Lutibacter holmesii]|uniref:DUF4296 domain-containing protein n=1 Tax=Lutibacter holmesii TaxID=1137985 RepID=A0ABW3WNY3_9FLAO